MTDEGLAERIANVLEWNVSIPDQAVNAEVKHGVVTRVGEVERQYQRANIERNIEQVSGVASVVNLMTIKPRASRVDIKMHIRDSLERHTEIEASKVVVSTSSNGTVILSGVADLLAEVDRIEEAAWATPGV